jgi:hypothetical protein
VVVVPAVELALELAPELVLELEPDELQAAAERVSSSIADSAAMNDKRLLCLPFLGCAVISISILR